MKLGFSFNVKNITNLAKGSSTTVDLKPIESNLDTARINLTNNSSKDVYLFGTNLKYAQAVTLPPNYSPAIPAPLSGGALMPVLVESESNGNTRFLAAADPANRNWNFIYNNVSYTWHPAKANSIVVTHLKDSCPNLSGQIITRADRTTHNMLAYELDLSGLDACHSDLEFKATVGSTNVPLPITSTGDKQSVMVPINPPSRSATGQLRVKFTLTYKKRGSSATANLTNQETVCNYKPVVVSGTVNNTTKKMDVRFDRSQTNGHCFTIPFDLTVTGNASGQFTANRTFSLLTGQTKTANATLSKTLAKGQTVRVMNGSRQEWAYTQQ
jgi:hypothetical protein